MTSQAENRSRIGRPDVALLGNERTQSFLAAGSVLGAVAASSCCIVPLLLFAIGAGGAWIDNLTWLAPYHAYFIGATAACLGGGYWLRYRSNRIACADGEVCARPVPKRIVSVGLVAATLLFIGALAVDFLAPLFY